MGISIALGLKEAGLGSIKSKHMRKQNLGKWILKVLCFTFLLVWFDSGGNFNDSHNK